MPVPSSDLQAVQERALRALVTAATTLAALPDGAERTLQLRALATLLVASTEEQKKAAWDLCPDLAHTEPTPDLEAAPSEMAIIRRLLPADIEAIDRALEAGALESWRKGTRVIGDALVSVEAQYPGIPLCFYAQRISALVAQGKLQQRGNPDFMRLCEIRLPIEAATVT